MNPRQVNLLGRLHEYTYPYWLLVSAKCNQITVNAWFISMEYNDSKNILFWPPLLLSFVILSDEVGTFRWLYELNVLKWDIKHTHLQSPHNFLFLLWSRWKSFHMLFVHPPWNGQCFIVLLILSIFLSFWNDDAYFEMLILYTLFFGESQVRV